MKAKLTTIREGGLPVDDDYLRLLEIPDVLDASNRRLAVLQNGSRRESQLATDIRTAAASPVKRRPLGPSEGGATSKWSGVGREVGGEGSGGEMGHDGVRAGAGVVDPRVVESMREIERRGLGLESTDDVGMDVMEGMEMEDLDPDADGDGDGDEEAMNDSDV